MRTVFVKLTVGLTINMDEGQDLSEVINELNYAFTASPQQNANVVDECIDDYEVTDSK